MAEFADAVAELMKVLGIKVWLVGQSLGGAAAQIITKIDNKKIGLKPFKILYLLGFS